MSTISNKKPSPLRRCFHATRRAVARSRDLFVRGAVGCARFVDAHGDAIGAYPGGFALAPVTCDFTAVYKASWTHEDGVRELLCASSSSSSSSSLQTQNPPVLATSTRRGAAVVGRIDEDVECEFGDELPVGSNLLLPVVSPSMRRATAGCTSQAKAGTCPAYISGSRCQYYRGSSTIPRHRRTKLVIKVRILG